jgi:hypothetical protein
MPSAVEYPDLPGWKFTVVERSMSSYELSAIREGGASVVLVGFDYEALLEQGRVEAARMESRLSDERGHWEV